ncbi:hypothetical protein AB0F46_40845 [Streptomyces sp. NPDC026665]|uniref:hypothetical protein n=1 Tax=Streptomyces sp. NPDC026665 TaxID=3154798 RepID=UPI0033FE2E8E
MENLTHRWIRKVTEHVSGRARMVGSGAALALLTGVIATGTTSPAMAASASASCARDFYYKSTHVQIDNCWGNGSWVWIWTGTGHSAAAYTSGNITVTSGGKAASDTFSTDRHWLQICEVTPDLKNDCSTTWLF